MGREDVQVTPRWYTHGWNRDLSWRLIHAILPRVPRFLRPPVHFITTLVCFAAMPRERRAVRLNLERVTGRSGLAARLLAFRLFYNFSKFMVGFTDLVRSDPARLRRWVDGSETEARRIEDLLAEVVPLAGQEDHGGELAAQVDHAAGLEIAAQLVHHLRQVGDDARAILSDGGQNELAPHGAPIVDQHEMKALSVFEVSTLCGPGTPA